MASGDAGIAHGSLRALALGALGDVYGDIGTSPGATPGDRNALSDRLDAADYHLLQIRGGRHARGQRAQL